jgi:hypothetical protein
MTTPRRQKTHTAWATDAPWSAMIPTSPGGWLVHEEPPTMMAWPRMVLGPRMPSSSIQATGVFPWRPSISMNSTTDWDAWT